MSSLLGTTWVHVFEEDTAGRAVFRSEDADIPLSRRPRERLQFHDDGAAVLLSGGPDDRFVAQPLRWLEEGGEVIVRDNAGVRLTVVERSADRIVVRFARQARA